MVGTSDTGAFLSEKQYGAVVNWGFFKGVSLGLEVQHGEFDTPAQIDVMTYTAQLALEF
jgi:hypothetical protein